MFHIFKNDRLYSTFIIIFSTVAVYVSSRQLEKNDEAQIVGGWATTCLHGKSKRERNKISSSQGKG